MLRERSTVSEHTEGQHPTRTQLPVVVYIVLAVVGLVGTWYFNLSFFATSPPTSLFAGFFANGASSSIAVDIIVAGLAASVFYVREGVRLGWRWWWIGASITLSFLIAVAFVFPLFLALRERDLARAPDDEQTLR